MKRTEHENRILRKKVEKQGEKVDKLGEKVEKQGEKGKKRERIIMRTEKESFSNLSKTIQMASNL